MPACAHPRPHCHTTHATSQQARLARRATIFAGPPRRPRALHHSLTGAGAAGVGELGPGRSGFCCCCSCCCVRVHGCLCSPQPRVHTHCSQGAGLSLAAPPPCLHTPLIERAHPPLPPDVESVGSAAAQPAHQDHRTAAGQGVHNVCQQGQAGGGHLAARGARVRRRQVRGGGGGVLVCMCPLRLCLCLCLNLCTGSRAPGLCVCLCLCLSLCLNLCKESRALVHVPVPVLVAFA